MARRVGSSDVVPPLSVLKEQADALTKKTQGKLEGHVRTVKDSQQIYHEFWIMAPSLDEYAYKLFYVKHGIELYPVWIHGPGLPEECGGGEQFQEGLRKILQSKKTLDLVNGLRAQVEAAST